MLPLLPDDPAHSGGADERAGILVDNGQGIAGLQWDVGAVGLPPQKVDVVVGIHVLHVQHGGGDVENIIKQAAGPAVFPDIPASVFLDVEPVPPAHDRQIRAGRGSICTRWKRISPSLRNRANIKRAALQIRQSRI